MYLSENGCSNICVKLPFFCFELLEILIKNWCFLIILELLFCLLQSFSKFIFSSIFMDKFDTLSQIINLKLFNSTQKSFINIIFS